MTINVCPVGIAVKWQYITFLHVGGTVQVAFKIDICLAQLVWLHIGSYLPCGVILLEHLRLANHWILKTSMQFAARAYNLEVTVQLSQ